MDRAQLRARGSTAAGVARAGAPGLGEVIAVIDIGSNSGRVVVYEVGEGGHLRILASACASLRLVKDLTEQNLLGPEAISRTLAALEDFRALAMGGGARRILAVATSAIRDAANGKELLERARRELGLELAVISGREEARYGFLGAVRGLPVEEGVMFDLGGGSMQVCAFRERSLGGHWSFPLGALRLSETFLSDPPQASEERALLAQVRDSLDEAGLPRLPAGGVLVGTGGSVRNLAKIDQQRRRYAIPHLHGYPLTRNRLKEVVELLRGQRQRELAAIPGLNDDRADSIVGGALAVLGLMRALHADTLLVSGHGVREGLAAGASSDRLPPAAQVRLASVRALGTAFRAWSPEGAGHRQAVANALFAALEPTPDPGLREMLDHAAALLDIGRSIDYFARYRHVSEIIMATDLQGFSHRDVALLSAVLMGAGDEGSSIDAYQPVLAKADRHPVERAATLLALADALEQRCRPGSPAQIDCQMGKREVRVLVPGLAGWRPRRIGGRFEKAFGRKLVVAAR